MSGEEVPQLQGERPPHVLRVATWNVNGLRAVLKTVGSVKGLLERLDAGGWRRMARWEPRLL